MSRFYSCSGVCSQWPFFLDGSRSGSQRHTLSLPELAESLFFHTEARESERFVINDDGECMR